VSITAAALTVVVGFGSGVVGAFAGGWAQRWLYGVRREDERLDDLWEYYRVLKIVSEHLTNEREGSSSVDLRDLERRVYRHMRYLPGELTVILEADESSWTSSIHEIGENLWTKASALKGYLDQEGHKVRGRADKETKLTKEP
jgi:hypothetical protein